MSNQQEGNGHGITQYIKAETTVIKSGPIQGSEMPFSILGHTVIVIIFQWLLNSNSNFRKPEVHLKTSTFNLALLRFHLTL